MADLPPPYTAPQPAYNPAYPPQNPPYPQAYPAPNPVYPPNAGGWGNPPMNQGYAQPSQPGPPSANKGYQYPPIVASPTSYPPPQPGFVVPPQPLPQQTTIVITGGQQPVLLAPGTCTLCRVGRVSEDFTCCGVCLAIFFFPLGLICCLLMREKRCGRCGATF